MRISFFCYPADDPWSPESTLTGIGGSEEAVINIARELSALGHQVTVRNSSCTEASLYQRVIYTNYQTLRATASIDIAIVWRYPGLYPRYLRTLRIGKTYLWLHDAFPSSRVLPHLAFFHKIMVLSQFHRSLYEGVDPRRIVVTRNGIDVSHFNQEVPRDCNKVVYGSSYDRGLRVLLERWKTIKLAVPLATLSIFYGWQSMERHKRPGYDFLRQHLNRLMLQTGVTHLGRIGHLDVARQYLSAGIWAYPCIFPEVSCISGMKAQAGGAVPVTIPTGALRETIKFGFKTDRSFSDFEDRTLPPYVVRQWVEALIYYLRHPEKQREIRPRMMVQSREWFSWRQVAMEWTEEFCRSD